MCVFCENAKITLRSNTRLSAQHFNDGGPKNCRISAMPFAAHEALPLMTMGVRRVMKEMMAVDIGYWGSSTRLLR